MDVGHHELETRVAGASSLILFLELERGLEESLSPTGDRSLSPELRTRIAEIASREGVLACVMDRRSLSEMKALIEDPRLVYVANQGMEIEGPAFHFAHPEALQCRSAIEALGQKLSGLPLLFPEISIESRSLALNIDFSRCPAQAAEELTALVRALVPADHADLIATLHGSRFEIRLRIDWDYGHAMRWILGRIKSPDTAIVTIGGEEIEGGVDGAIPAPTANEGAGADKTSSSDVAAFLGWLDERWQERVEMSPDSPEVGPERPALSIKEASPILNVRLRRAAMGRKRSGGG